MFIVKRKAREQFHHSLSWLGFCLRKYRDRCVIYVTTSIDDKKKKRTYTRDIYRIKQIFIAFTNYVYENMNLLD